MAFLLSHLGEWDECALGIPWVKSWDAAKHPISPATKNYQIVHHSNVSSAKRAEKLGFSVKVSMFHWTHRGDTYRSNREDSCVQIVRMIKGTIKQCHLFY